MALILNVSTSAAATVATDQIAPKVTAVDPVNKAVILNSKPVKVTFNEPIKAGNKWIVLKNSAGKVISTKNTISGRTVTVTPNNSITKNSKIHTHIPLRQYYRPVRKWDGQLFNQFYSI